MIFCLNPLINREFIIHLVSVIETFTHGYFIGSDDFTIPETCHGNTGTMIWCEFY